MKSVLQSDKHCGGKKKTEQNKRTGNADVGAGRELMFPLLYKGVVRMVLTEKAIFRSRLER